MIRKIANEELARMDGLFRKAYSHEGRPSIPPEMLILASLLQTLYSIPSERMLCEQIGQNMLFRWFVGLKSDDDVFDHSTFSKNRERFAEHGFMEAFFNSTVARIIREQATSCEEFSVDGTLIQSFASMKSLKHKDDDTPYDSGGFADFKGEKRGNDTHESKTDPEARLMRKGNGRKAILAHSMHIIVDNQQGMIMAVSVDEANGTAERKNAIKMVKGLHKRHRLKPRSLAADKGYDSGDYLLELEKHDITPQVAMRDLEPKVCTPEADARRSMFRRMKTAACRCPNLISEHVKPVAVSRFSMQKSAWDNEIVNGSQLFNGLL